MARKVKKGGNVQNNEIVGEVKGSHGSNYLVVKLNKGQKIQSSPESLIYLRGDVEKGEIKNDWFSFKAVGRVFAGEDLLLTSYTGGENGGFVALGSPIPGDVIEISVKTDEPLIISRGSFLCGTEDIEVTSTSQLKGLFNIGQEEGFILPVVKTNNPNGGKVWLSAYGTFEKIELSENEKLILDNGTFLARPITMRYHVVQLGKSLVSSFLGGEGFGMEYTGPGYVYMQSKNLNEFFGVIEESLKKKQQGGSKTHVQSKKKKIVKNTN